MIAWSPVELTTELHCLRETAIAVYAGRTVLFVTVTRARGSHAPRGTVSVWAQTSDQFTKKHHVIPGYVTLASFALTMGVLPERAIVLPGIAWAIVGLPTINRGDGFIEANRFIEEGPPASVRRAGALAQVDGVKETYGRMLGDIAYRIENSALFDSAVPLSRQFDAALAMWDDLADDADEDEVVRIAGLVKLTFETARANAETLGMSHLPDTARDEAGRAAKAARLAAGSSSSAERAAAQEQVIRILRSLALYYLPDPERLPAALSAPPR